MRGRIGTARKDRKGLLEMPVNKKMKIGDFEYFYSDKVACCKMLDRRLVTMLFSNVEAVKRTSTVHQPAGKKYRRQKSKYLSQTLSKCTIKK